MDYQPGDEILKLTDNPSTLQDCGIGPFHMTQVCRNGSISIQHISHFVEHINICQVKHIGTVSAHGCRRVITHNLSLNCYIDMLHKM